MYCNLKGERAGYRCNGEPIIGATVTLKGTNQRTVTDLDGNFELPNVTKGGVVVSYVGFKTAEQAVT